MRWSRNPALSERLSLFRNASSSSPKSAKVELWLCVLCGCLCLLARGAALAKPRSDPHGPRQNSNFVLTWIVQSPPALADDERRGTPAPPTMDDYGLIASVLFGLVGMGMFMYGRKAGRMVPLVAGGLLMVVPYFLPNWIAQTVVCTALSAAPWVVRE